MNRPTISIPAVGDVTLPAQSVTERIVNEALARRERQERVHSYSCQPGDNSSWYRVNLEPTTSILPSLHVLIQREKEDSFYAQALIGVHDPVIGEAFAASALRIALHQPLSRVPKTLVLQSLTAGPDKAFWQYDNALQGIEALVKRYGSTLEERGVTFQNHGDSVRITGLPVYAQHLRETTQ